MVKARLGRQDVWRSVIMKFPIFLTMKRVVVGFLCGAGALTSVACADGRGGPTSPSARGTVSSLAATAPGHVGTVPQPVAAATPAEGQLPFHGSLEAAETDTFSFPFVTVSLTGAGQATDLGRFTATFGLQVDVRTSTSLGAFTLIAANGDRVFGTLSGHSTDVGGIASIVETAITTGGTGRFADATGSFIIERVLDLATGISSGSFNGTISY
jgi:hypothetical protein